MEGKLNDESNGQISPLSAEVRKEFPTIIYEQITDSSERHYLVSAIYTSAYGE